MSIEMNKRMPTAVVVIYDGFDMLDIAGPFSFFYDAGMKTVLAGIEKRTYMSGEGVEYIAKSSFVKLEEEIIFYGFRWFGARFFGTVS